jgi:hypothetical protein
MQASLQRRGLIWRKDFYTKKIFQKVCSKRYAYKNVSKRKKVEPKEQRKIFKKLENNFEKETKKIYLK